MPIPLGILAAAGVRPAVAAGAYELIETVTVGSGGAATIEFSNLNTWATTYQHLQVRMVGRSNSSSALVSVRLNGDSGANYAYHWLSGRGSNPAVSEGYANDSQMYFYAFTQGTDTAGVFGACVMDLLDPYEAKNKTVRILNSRRGGSNPEVNFFSGLWRNTTGLTTLTFTMPGTSFAQGSRFSIYGLKGTN